jgi:hypothetical protein
MGNVLDHMKCRDSVDTVRRKQLAEHLDIPRNDSQSLGASDLDGGAIHVDAHSIESLSRNALEKPSFSAANLNQLTLGKCRAKVRKAFVELPTPAVVLADRLVPLCSRGHSWDSEFRPAIRASLRDVANALLCACVYR